MSSKGGRGRGGGGGRGKPFKRTSGGSGHAETTSTPSGKRDTRSGGSGPGSG